MEIYYDEPHEGIWFQEINPRLSTISLQPITGASARNSSLEAILAYDRPDVILTQSGEPILMVERTVEVPSGHNVGQRFARLAAAAQCHVPIVLILPYVAHKHGGITSGPRYINLRLFYALDAMAVAEATSVVTINWPVDDKYEVIKDKSKDDRFVRYMEVFFSIFDAGGLTAVNAEMKNSPFYAEQITERERFIRNKVKRASVYDTPPGDSVVVALTRNIPCLESQPGIEALRHEETILYRVGSQNIRSDPYAGAGMMYEYLYAGSPSKRTRNFVFHFPFVSVDKWNIAANGRSRKDIRLFTKVADAILFADAFLTSDQLRS